MEKLRKLMKEHQDKADKKVMGEVLELLQREPGLFVVTVHATKNFFLGAENGKAAAFLYTSREYADEFERAGDGRCRDEGTGDPPITAYFLFQRPLPQRF